MNRLNKKMIAFLALAIVLGITAYWTGTHYWGKYHNQAAQVALECRDFPQASFHLAKVLDAAPNDLNARILAAQTARRQGDFAEAHRHLQMFTSPNNARVELEQRLLRLQQGDLSEGDELLAIHAGRHESQESALVLEAYIEGSLKALLPAHLQGGTAVGTDAWAQVERTHQAVERWLQQRSGPSDQIQGLLWRFQTYSFARAPSKAAQDIRKAMDMAPDHREVRFYMAVFLMQESPAEAAVHLEVLHERYPEDQKVGLMLAKLRRGLGQLDESREIVDRFLTTHPDHVPFLVERGRIALDMQQPGEAESWLLRAFRRTPDSREINLALSSCLRLNGKTDEALVYQKRFDQLEAEAKRHKASRPQEKKAAEK